MSRYYGSLQGSRGEATRQGTAKSGIDGHIRGWHIGGSVSCFPSCKDGEDVVKVAITGGSSNSSTLISLGTFKLIDGKPVKVED